MTEHLWVKLVWIPPTERRLIETRVETVTVMEWASPARAMYVLTAILGYSHAEATATLARLQEHHQRADGRVLMVAQTQQRVTAM